MRPIVAGTGHRPNKLGGYGEDVFERLTQLARSFLLEVDAQHVISGMALGWDQALATAAIQLSIPFTAACAFQGMHLKWPESTLPRLRHLLGQAQHVEIVSHGGYKVWKMMLRNEWMVDRAELIAALWDGSPGGTKNCLDYAAKARPDLPVRNLWPEWCN